MYTYTNVYPFQSPPIPSDGRFYIPIEVTSNADVKSLNVMQAVLEEFGFGGPLSRLAYFIHTSPHFAAVLSSKIYPVLYPTEYYAVYQTWR